MWGATINELYYSIVSKFQSTHPCGVRLDKNEKLIKIVNFNPRTHVGCDPSFSKRVTMAGISIHAPMWGATGSTKKWCAGTRNFNPRTHVGCDIIATRNIEVLIDFNPRTHVGCDNNASALAEISYIFQSTHPCGVRRYAIELLMEEVDFNPRTHVGCDLLGGATCKNYKHFNPRTHVGCD